MCQATNWASRQGFTEFIRPRIPIDGAIGELVAGCIGGTLSAWNTPFEVARIQSQSSIMTKSEDGNHAEKENKSLFVTMSSIVEERGAGALYVGLIPRSAQVCRCILIHFHKYSNSTHVSSHVHYVHFLSSCMNVSTPMLGMLSNNISRLRPQIVAVMDHKYINSSVFA